ncbi:MAG: DUF3549 family protein [Thiotrichaceae bacterium]|nr:DUF3549 family protein [Thiotrichaceae bacterium]
MTDPITIDNISKFFELSQYQYRIFDMSRTVNLMPNDTFKAIETQQALYPTPFQQHAWLGILFWHEESANEPAIWFLKFPIDELSFLKVEARDAFIQEMLEQVGEKIKNPDGNKESKQHESSFAFKPPQDKMAIFNAMASRELNSKPSQYYANAQQYLSGELGYAQWSSLGFQGLADIVANLSIDNNMSRTAQAIEQIPDQPLAMLAQLLEHNSPDANLSNALFDRLQMTINAEAPNIALASALSRALSSSTLSTQTIDYLLDSSVKNDIEILSVIASRAWLTLTKPQRLKNYLQALATQPQNVFDVLLMELLPIPDMRDPILNGLKDPKRDQNLSQRIAGFMQRFQA